MWNSGTSGPPYPYSCRSRVLGAQGLVVCNMHSCILVLGYNGTSKSSPTYPFVASARNAWVTCDQARSGLRWASCDNTSVAPSRGTQRLFSSLMLLQPHKPARADAIWALAMEKPQFVLDCGPLIHLIPCTAIVRTRIMEKRSLSYGYTGTSSKRMTQQRRAGEE